jgi:hypothetical protein
MLTLSFCEEYPTERNLDRARLIPFPATVFLAAESLPAYEDARDRLASVNPQLRAAWWPVPRRARALSAICEPSEIRPLSDALRVLQPGVVLLDLELPVWDRRRLIGRLTGLSEGRRAIDGLFSTALERHEVWTAEWPPFAPAAVRRALRLSLPQASRRVYMLYSSMLPGRWRQLLIRRMRRLLASPRAGIGVGVLATGVTGREPLLSPAELTRDLLEAGRLGASTVMIYRLGGVEERHVPALVAANGHSDSAAGTS